MCMILDNNTWGDFLNQKPDMQPIHNWLKQKKGKLVYSNHKGFQELSNKYYQSLEKYKEAGQADLIPSKKVEKAINEIKKEHDIKKSDDPHILGLAKVSKVTVLCTKDKLLHKYFKEIIGGNIYQNKNHQHLLTADLCKRNSL